MCNESDISYVINADDQIACVNPAWHAFATTNDGAELAEPGLLGRSLWDFIADEPTRQLYRQIVARVRQGRLARFTLRCDGPSCRRLLEMTISARPQGAVEFVTRVLRAEHREPPPLLALDSARSNEVLRLCAWCNRINLESSGIRWVEVEEATEQLMLFERARLPQLTHGICEDCLETMMNTLTAMPTGVEPEIVGVRRQ